MTDLSIVAENCTCFRLRRAARQISRAYDAVLRPSGLKITQFTLMVALERSGDISISGLADRLGMERTTLTRNIRPLVEKGFLHASAEGYKRTRTLSLTREGRRQLEAAFPLWQQAQARMQAQLGGREDVNELNSLLDTVT